MGYIPSVAARRRQATLGTKRPLEGYNLPVYLLAPRRPGEPPGRHRGLIGIGKSSVNGGYSYYIAICYYYCDLDYYYCDHYCDS